MVAKAPQLIEEPLEFHQRDGLFYVTVTVGVEKIPYVARPHLFLASARQACEVGKEFMAAQCEPVPMLC